LYQSEYIQFNNNKWHYLKIGNGKKLIITFHGYGNDADMFLPFQDYLKDFTIISINLPYHGKTEWNKADPVQIDELVTLVNVLIEDANVDKFCLLGYSMGARACLCIAEQIPEQVDKILLIAPDGLVRNGFYQFVTKNSFGKWLFKDFLDHPDHYMPLVNLLKRTRVISPGRHKFAMYYINKQSEREKLLRIWPNMHLIIPDRVKLKRLIEEYRIPVHIFIGSYDKVIPLKNAKKFMRGLSTVQLHIFDKGHWLLDEDTISEMAQTLTG
jgi:pimeloyl-ACP methyl ester carboxylesterase